MTGTDVVLAPQRPSMVDKVEYARVLAESGLLPAQYRKQPANVLYAVEYGEMLGLSAMAAIVGVWIIEGRPSASAALISALVRKAGHKLRVTGDGQRAVAEIIRHDDPEFAFRVEWTLDRARQAGLLGKDIWKKYAPNMLKHRAVSECANDACQEVLFGLITPEELGVDVNKDGEPLVVTSHRIATPVIPEPGEPEAPDWDMLITTAEDAGDVDTLHQLWDMAKGMFPNDLELLDRIAAAGKRLKPGGDRAKKSATPEKPEPMPTTDDAVVGLKAAAEVPLATSGGNQRSRLYALLANGGIASRDRATRLLIVSRVLNRPPAEPVKSFDDLTPEELTEVNSFLQRRKDSGDLTATLVELASAAEAPTESDNLF